MLGSRRTKDFQAISGCMLLQNCGVGEDTTINLTRPVVLTVLQAGYIIFGILFVVSLVLFILRRRKFMQSPEYLEFKALKAQRKQQS